MWKLILLVLLGVGAALGLSRLGDIGGDVALHSERLGGTYSLNIYYAALAALIFLVGVLLLLRLLRYLFIDHNREVEELKKERGYDAVTDGLIALAEGDGETAARKAKVAERLLEKKNLTRLMSAQALELSGKPLEARRYYQAMLADKKTEFSGVRGLLNQAVSEGETEAASALAERAQKIKPKHHGVLSTAFSLHSQAGNWERARIANQSSVGSKLLTRDVGKRREAVLLVAEAQSDQSDGKTHDALNKAKEAVRKSPGLIPAANLAASLSIEKGNTAYARKTLERAWGQNPHPDLAATYAAIQPNESVEERRRRFKKLTKQNPYNIESRLLEAELALAAEDFPQAKKALGEMATTHPSARAFAIRAAISKGEGDPEHEVRAWLARALEAPRGAEWACASCNHVESRWTAICSRCENFDTLEWRKPEEVSGRSKALGTAIAPLLASAPATAMDEPGVEGVFDEQVETLAEGAEESIDVARVEHRSEAS